MNKIGFLLLMFVGFSSYGQNKVDGIEAIVGDKIILFSDIENQLLQFLAQNPAADKDQLRCQIIDEMMFQKLLSNQAEVDSIEVTNEEVEEVVNQRVDFFMSKLGGSVRGVERYFDKPIEDLKDDLYNLMKDQMLAQRMESKITSSIKTTPFDVRKFFNEIPKDSLPTLPAEIELSQIVIYPKISSIEKARLTNKLLEYKKRVQNGEDFSFLASLYSQDEGSVNDGGDLGYVGKGKLVPEFEAAAFRLQKGQISDPVKTKYGFHLIQMIDRKGEQFRIRHLLLKPSYRLEDFTKVKSQLDSISMLIRSDSLSFAEAALKFSQDDSKNNGGIILNPQTGGSSFLIEELDSELSLSVNGLSEGEISIPFNFTNFDQRVGCRIIFVNSLSEPHIANLSDDYDRLQNFTLQQMKSDALANWRNETIANTFIKLNTSLSCDLLTNWKQVK